MDLQESRFYNLLGEMSGSRDMRVDVCDGFVYMCRVVDCGGGTLMNSMLRFDPRHLATAELTPCRRLRIDPAVAALDGGIYIVGGTNEHMAVLDSVERYDVKRNVWSDVAPLPIITHACAATVLNGQLYVTGGVAGPEQKLTAAVHVYNPTTRSWTDAAPMHCARRLHQALTAGDRIFVLGGIGTHSYHQQTQIPMESYNPATDAWTLLTSTLAGRAVGHFISYGGGILSLGREHYDAAEDDIWQYDAEADAWKRSWKFPRRTLQSTTGVLLPLNTHDDKISKQVISEKSSR